MPDGPKQRLPDSDPPVARRVLFLTTLLAGAAAMSRDADGTPLLPIWLAAGLQLPALIAWIALRCAGARRHQTQSDHTDRTASRTRRADRVSIRVNRVLTTVVGVCGIALAFRHGSGETACVAMTTLIAGSLLVETLHRVYRRLDETMGNAAAAVGVMIRPWLWMVVLATVLLAAPLATRSEVPDFRHNFWQHVLNSAFAAVSASCLVGTTIYQLAEDYTRFGQIVLIGVSQLAGFGLCAVGLAIVRPFLARPIRLRAVWRAAIVIQAIGVLVTLPAWSAADAPNDWVRLWWSCVHVTGAFWNAGWVMRPDGLAAYMSSGLIYAATTALAIIGSIGLPVLWDAVAVRRGRDDAGGAGSWWQALPRWEVGAAFWLLITGALLLWVFETPGLPFEQWSPPRPVDAGGRHVAMRETAAPGARWSLAMFVSASSRSAGMQSIELTPGAMSWPAGGVLAIWTFIGGSAGGAAGGMRVTALLLVVLGLLARSGGLDDRAGRGAVRRLLLRGVPAFAATWALMNAASFLALSAVSDGTSWERTIEAVAACNGVGLSTGLSIHLTWAGRLTMILIMLAGRLVPVVWWSRMSCRVTRHSTS